MGSPLKIDKATLDGDFSHFARIIIDVDLSKNLQDSIILERDDHSFLVDIEYENLPDFCSHCQSVGDVVINCCKFKSEQPAIVEESVKQKNGKKIYKPIIKEPVRSSELNKEPCNEEVTTNDSNLQPSVASAQEEPQSETNSPPANPSNSSYLALVLHDQANKRRTKEAPILDEIFSLNASSSVSLLAVVQNPALTPAAP